MEVIVRSLSLRSSGMTMVVSTKLLKWTNFRSADPVYDSVKYYYFQFECTNNSLLLENNSH